MKPDPKLDIEMPDWATYYQHIQALIWVMHRLDITSCNPYNLRYYELDQYIDRIHLYPYTPPEPTNKHPMEDS